MKTNFIIICEQAFLTAGSNNLNLIGIFTNINTEKFPVAYPRFSVAVNFDTNMRGEHEMRAEVAGPDGSKLAEVKLPVRIGASPFQLIVNLTNLSFPAPGAYEIRLSLDNEPLGSRAITVSAVMRGKTNLA